MSANLSYLFRRRPQRYEWGETMPDGSPVSDIGLPEVLRMPNEGQGVPLTRRIYSTPDWSSDPTPAPVAAVPDAAPAVRPRRIFTPPKWETEPQPVADPQERERIANPREFMTNRINDVVSHPTQQNTNSRLGGGLRAGGRVGLRVLRETGNPFAALGATISGFGYGLANKEYDEQLAEEESAGRMQGRVAQMDANEAAALERAGKVADITLKQANAAKALREPAIKPDVQIVKGRGGFYAVDKNNVGAQPTRLPIDPDEPDKPPTMFDWAGQRMTVVPDGKGGWKAEPLAGVPVDKSEVPVVEDGLTVKPGTALSARATREQRTYQRGRDAAKDAEDAERIRVENEQKDYDRAKADVKEYNDLVAAGEQARREALALSRLKQSLKEGETLTDAEQVRLDEAVAKHESIRKQLEGRKVESPYAELGPDGRYRLKGEPKRRAVRSSSSTGRGVSGATPARVQNVIERIRKRK